jgi:hypothetical protein
VLFAAILQVMVETSRIVDRGWISTNLARTLCLGWTVGNIDTLTRQIDFRYVPSGTLNGQQFGEGALGVRISAASTRHQEVTDTSLVGLLGFLDVDMSKDVTETR